MSTTEWDGQGIYIDNRTEKVELTANHRGRCIYFSVCCGCRMVHEVTIDKSVRGVVIEWGSPRESNALEVERHVTAESGPGERTAEIARLRALLKRVAESPHMNSYHIGTHIVRLDRATWDAVREEAGR